MEGIARYLRRHVNRASLCGLDSVATQLHLDHTGDVNWAELVAPGGATASLA